MKSIFREACVESLNQGIDAARAGADRIELCAHLSCDGLTPKKSVIEQAFQQIPIPIRVMIRPRAGGFRYTDPELEEMARSIRYCKNVGVEGVVFGLCEEGSTLDLDRISHLAALASPMKVTIHKAIDSCDDPVREVGRLKSVGGIDAVLTSGGQDQASVGVERIKAMIDEAGDAINIIACGRITPETLPELHSRLNAPAYHGRRIVGDLGD